MEFRLFRYVQRSHPLNELTDWRKVRFFTFRFFSKGYHMNVYLHAPHVSVSCIVSNRDPIWWRKCTSSCGRGVKSHSNWKFDNVFCVSDASGFVEPCDKYIDHNSLHWWVRKFKMPFQTLYGCNRIFLAFFVSLSNTGTPLFSPHLFTCIARGKYWKLKLCYLATSSFVNLSRALRNILLGSIV